MRPYFGARKSQLSKIKCYLRKNSKTDPSMTTKLRAIWEELESLNVYPAFTQMTPERSRFTDAIRKIQDSYFSKWIG